MLAWASGRVLVLIKESALVRGLKQECAVLLVMQKAWVLEHN